MTTTDTLAQIRAGITAREWSASELQRGAGISYRAAWTLVRGESKRIDWATLDRVLTALGLRLV